MGHLFAQDNGKEITGATPVVLGTPVVQGPVTLFQAGYLLRIPVSDQTTALQLDAQASLSVQFSDYSLSLAQGSSLWYKSPVTSAKQGEYAFNLVLPVRLDHLSSSAYTSAKLYRMDGPKKVDDPTLTVPVGAYIGEDFVAARFTVGLEAPPANAQSGNPVTLHIKGRPTSPRVRLSMQVGEGNQQRTELLWQWLDFPGEQMQARTATINAASWQSALARALSLRASGQSELLLNLDVISDAPCQVVITPMHFSFTAQAPAMPATSLAATGGSLRFSGAQHTCQQMALTKPGGAARSVVVDMAVTRSGEPALPGLPTLSEMGSRGFALQGGEWLARPWPQAEACMLAGLALPWWPLEAGATLTLSLHADQAGHPADTALAQTTLSTDTAAAHWLSFRWPAQTLQPGGLWLKLAVKEGAGLWLGQTCMPDTTVARQSAEQPHQHLSSPLLPWALALPTSLASAPALQCSINGQAMVLTPGPTASGASAPTAPTAKSDASSGTAEPRPHAERWLATLSTVPAELQGASAWTLTVCSDEGLLVALQDVQVTAA